MPLRVIFLILYAIPLITWSGLPKNRPALSLHPEVQSGLQILINEATALHEAMGSKVSQAVLEAKVHTLQNQIALIYSQFSLMAYSPKKNHAIKLLGIIDGKLEGLRIQGEKGAGKQSIKKLFGTIAELAQAYHIKTASSGVFYCSRDKGLWVQSGNQAKNPISPDLKNCGKRVW